LILGFFFSLLLIILNCFVPAAEPLVLTSVGRVSQKGQAPCDFQASSHNRKPKDIMFSDNQINNYSIFTQVRTDPREPAPFDTKVEYKVLLS
jgi:hypothetical protein